MNGTILYSNTSITNTSGEISLNHHTNAIYFFNNSDSIDAIVKLNGMYQVLLPHRPNQSPGLYVCVPGDYTKIEVVTASVTISVFAIG